MRWIATLRLRLRSLVSGRRAEQELDEELRYHFDRLVEGHVAAGASPANARRAARRDMGAVEQRKEECRDARGVRPIERLRSDLGYSLRQLRKHPVFTAAAVTTLALGIGPNAATVSLVSSVFRPLPVADAHEMTVLATTQAGRSRVWQRVAYPDYQDYRASGAFVDAAAWDLNPVGLTADGRTDRLMATVVTGNYFSMLRLDPSAGRLILPSDGELGGTEPVVVLSHAYWTRRFGGSASAIGREVRIDGRPFTVIGVAPPDFHGTFTLMSSDAYLPLELFQGRHRLMNRDVLSVRAIARLKPGATLEEARASVDAVAARLERDHPGTNTGRRVRVFAERLARPEPQNESQSVFAAALFLMLVGAVLLIACANVLGLFLARSLGRAREMAIRAALGASRWDLVRLCLVEALLIAGLGASAGAIAGLALARGFAAVAATPGFPLFLDVRVDWGTTAYLAFLLVVSTLAIGFLPALRVSRVDPRSDLAGGPDRAAGSRRQLTRKGLAAAQMAASVVLLVVCGLFIRSVHRLQSVDLGFDAARVLTASTNPAAAGYDTAALRSFYTSLDAALEALPEVESAAASAFVPFGTSNSTAYVGSDRDGPPSSATGLLADRHFVTGDYFRTMGIPVLRGRTFVSTDRSAVPRAALVSEALAAQLWPGEDPIGRRFRDQTEPDAWLQVIGLVPDVRFRRGEIGGPAAPRYFVSLDRFDDMARALHVRSRSSSADPLPATVQATIRRLGPTLPIEDVRTLERHVNDSSAGFGGARGGAFIAGVLGALALLLALVGTYGVLSFTVKARTREIGIRMALGFEASRVFRMLLWESWRIALFGVTVGLALSVAAGKAIEGLLFGIVSYDPATLGAVAVVMAVVSTLVGVLPARRAARVNPIETLRYE